VGYPCNIVEVAGRRPRVAASAYVDPAARVMGDVELGEEVVVLYGTVIRGDDDRVRVGARTVVLENSLVEAPKGKPVEIGEEALVRRRDNPRGPGRRQGPHRNRRHSTRRRHRGRGGDSRGGLPGPPGQDRAPPNPSHGGPS